MEYGKHSLVLCGGGLDSFVSAWDSQLAYPEDRTVLLYVDYRAKARRRELEATEKLADAMNTQFGKNTASVMHVDFPFFAKYLSTPLTDNGVTINTKTPRLGVATEWVPARNTVLMSLAIAIAESEKFARVVTGINRTASVAYPDNDVQWIYRFEDLLKYAINRGRHLELEAPVGNLTKDGIVKLAVTDKMPLRLLAKSWSCYDGKPLHCGKCSSCRSRKKAFELAESADFTQYTSSLIDDLLDGRGNEQ